MLTSLDMPSASPSTPPARIWALQLPKCSQAWCRNSKYRLTVCAFTTPLCLLYACSKAKLISSTWASMRMLSGQQEASASRSATFNRGHTSSRSQDKDCSQGFKLCCASTLATCMHARAIGCGGYSRHRSVRYESFSTALATSTQRPQHASGTSESSEFQGATFYGNNGYRPPVASNRGLEQAHHAHSAKAAACASFSSVVRSL